MPKRRLIETASGDGILGLQGSVDTQINSQSMPNGVPEVVIEKDNSQSREVIPNGHNEDQKSQPNGADAGGTQFSRGSTLDAEEEADVFRNPRMLQDPTGRLCKYQDCLREIQQEMGLSLAK